MQVIVEDLFYDRVAAPVGLVFGDAEERRTYLGGLLDARGVRVAREACLGEALSALDALLPLAAGCVAEPSDEGQEEEGEDAARRRRLAALGEEAGRISRALVAMAADAGGGEIAAAPSVDAAAELIFLRMHVRLRRLRTRCFDAALFADPAWDMLLDLRLAALEGRRVAVSSLCIAAAVPATTALRWIGVMIERGLFRRVPDPYDGRRAFITLSAAADAAMARFAAMGVQVGRG